MLRCVLIFSFALNRRSLGVGDGMNFTEFVIYQRSERGPLCGRCSSMYSHMRSILWSREVASVRFLIFLSNREGGRRLRVGYYTQWAAVSHSCEMTAIIHKFPREGGRKESVMPPHSFTLICCDSTWARSTAWSRGEGKIDRDIAESWEINQGEWCDLNPYDWDSEKMKK